MAIFEPPTFYGYQQPDPWTVNNWLFEMDQYFGQMGVSNEIEKVHLAKIYLAGRALEDWHYCPDLHRSWHYSPIT